MNIRVDFPYPDYAPLEIPSGYKIDTFSLPESTGEMSEYDTVKKALDNPIGSRRLSELAVGRQKILILSDDISRPTPVKEFVNLILSELYEAGVKKGNIEFLIALGTHRPMTEIELTDKLGKRVVSQHKVHNHSWEDRNALEYIGDTAQGVPVWINRKIREADLVIGLGAIMPLEVSGFTGGGKIVLPGVSGEETVDEMHWKRIDIPTHEILGNVDNPVRQSIDAVARKAGLDFIVNVVLSSSGKIAGAVAGDMVEAHREGCKIAQEFFGVRYDDEYDIVIADAYPFDMEFWQANKALDTAGLFVKRGGTVILVSPCSEGFSRSHENEILNFGYQPLDRIKKLVEDGKIKHKVVGVHMYQVSTVAIEKARLILVSTGISREEAEKVGFLWAKSPPEAFRKALDLWERDTSVTSWRPPASKTSGQPSGKASRQPKEQPSGPPSGPPSEIPSVAVLKDAARIMALRCSSS